MTQKYGNDIVYSPGTVIISAVAEISDIKRIVEPVMVNDPDSSLIFIDFSRDTRKLGGSSFAQSMNCLGQEAPSIRDPVYFVNTFNTIQELINEGLVMAGHDISSGGMITTLLEMNFSNSTGGMVTDFSRMHEKDPVSILFAENPGVIIQVKNRHRVESKLAERSVDNLYFGKPCSER